MPTKCSICPFNAYYENLGEYICEYVGKIIDKDERWEKKLDDCPLVEIVTCKDCKYYRNGLEHCTQWVMSTNDDFYCANGKIKE